MTEAEFRQKYPHSTDEQVRLYGEAVRAEAAGPKPPVEPDILMPLITVPDPVYPSWINPDDMIPQTTVTTYAVPSTGYTLRNFSLDDVPPEVPSMATDAEMRDILLGPFNSHLSPEQRQRFQTTDMSADEMLAAFFDPKWTPGGLGPN